MATKKLAFAMPSDRPGDTVILKDPHTNEAVFEIKAVSMDAFEVRALPRFLSTGLVVRPDTGNKVTVFHADLIATAPRKGK